MKFDKTHYHRMDPDFAEGEIGGSVISELLEGDHFGEMPDDYDLVYYLSKDRFKTSEGNTGPVHVVAVYREGRPGQRVFSLNHYQFALDLEDDELDGYPEDWQEVTILDELASI